MSIFGIPSVVAEVSQRLDAARGFTYNEMDIPPTLELDFTAFEAKYHTYKKVRGEMGKEIQ